MDGRGCCSGKTKDEDTCEEEEIPCPTYLINGETCISGNYLVFATFVRVAVSVSVFS